MQNEIHLLLDRTGSMSGTEAQTIEAINGFMEQMKADKLGQSARFTLTTFDSQGIDSLRRGVMSEVTPLQTTEFVPRAASPIFDAVGTTIGKMGGEGKRVFVILTDGLENASQKFTHAQVRALIEEKRAAGWVVIYLAANIDAWEQAKEIGVPGEMAMNFKQNPVPATTSSLQPGQVVSATSRFTDHVAKHPMGYALGAAALVGLAYLAFGPDEAHAAPALGFTDEDRNASMGVDGVSQTWQDAVAEDVANFVEPIPSGSIFDLPADVAEAQANLPADFDPTLGSMVDGVQATDSGGDILTPSDVPTSADSSALPDTSSGAESLTNNGTDVVDTGGEDSEALAGIDSSDESFLDSLSSDAESALDSVVEFAAGAVDVAGSVASGAADVAGSVISGAAEVASSMFD